MPAPIKPFVAILLLLSLVSKGFGECSLNDINVGTVRSGREVEGKPQWDVTVVNNCKCPQSQIKFACKGFKTVEPINPLILAKQGDECLLINGKTLPGFATVKFSYAWDPPFVLFPSGSAIGPC
ncbi:hypothetical protein SLE2022_034900 [Rubroshorea leprosula]|uniref:Uncharacterized protein n=1 Tax=Rubroshorea leprosula TaxID=152421 RepID=A0AAV5IMU6_9ROSI|nr:hypothetical protein SLEP1_g15572 [Rubroshorea leprosula]